MPLFSVKCVDIHLENRRVSQDHTLLTGELDPNQQQGPVSMGRCLRECPAMAQVLLLQLSPTPELKQESTPLVHLVHVWKTLAVENPSVIIFS